MIENPSTTESYHELMPSLSKEGLDGSDDHETISSSSEHLKGVRVSGSPTRTPFNGIDQQEEPQAIKSFPNKDEGREVDNQIDDDADSIVSDVSGLSDTFPDLLVKRVLRKSKMESMSILPTTVSTTTTTTSPTPERNALTPRRSSMRSSSSRNSNRFKSDDPDRMFDFDFRVSFKNVFVREYERILGDNPACSSGPSLSIGWEYKEVETFTVDEWESNRDDILYKELADLAISPRERILWLQGLGYSDEEIEQCMKDINSIKQRRQKTAQSTIVQKTEEVLVTAKIRLDKLFRGKRSSSSSGKVKSKHAVKIATYAA